MEKEGTIIFKKIKDFIRQVFSKMFNKNTLEKAIQVDVVTSDKMARAIQQWTDIYEDNAPWLSCTVQSMNLGAVIASEYARLTTLELESKVEGNEYLNEQYQAVIEQIRIYTEYACAKGGLVLKPFVNGKNIEVCLVQADCFFPTAYNSRGEVTGAVFVDVMTIGQYKYARLEYHNLDKEGYYISNKAYKTKNTEDSEALGIEVSLAEVNDWSDLEEEVLIKNIDKPLFAYFKMPIANTIDNNSPLGVSVFSRAINDIKEADKQYSRLLWEFEGSELAVEATVDAFKISGQDGYEIPEGKERLYRIMHFGVGETKDLMRTFSPEIRDASLLNGLNALLRQIEYKCGLAYGTISDPQQVDKTAEEIKTSKQRSYQSVSDTQKALQKALEHLVYCMSVIGQLAGLPVGGKHSVVSKWDDSILVDAEKERMQDRQDVAIQVMSLTEYRAKWYGETEEEAKKKILENGEMVKDDTLE